MAKGTRPKRGLGRGLNQLLGNIGESGELEQTSQSGSEKGSGTERKDLEDTGGETLLKLEEILTNGAQPRKNFDGEELEELTDSVRQYGVLQPILVQKEGKKYRIIAGERRYRAAKNAGLKEIPVLIRSYTTQQAAEIAIIENVQREDLNPLEEAMAYQTLIDDYGLKQDEIAARVSKNRATVANALRLLKLKAAARQFLEEGKISAGHARALLMLEDEKKQNDLARDIVEKNLSVREAEKQAKQMLRPKRREETEEDQASKKQYEILYRNYEDYMRSALGTKVRINRRDRNKGRIEIDYYSAAELERIMDLIQNIHS